jgi:hypothetical protein
MDFIVVWHLQKYLTRFFTYKKKMKITLTNKIGEWLKVSSKLKEYNYVKTIIIAQWLYQVVKVKENAF